MSRKNGSLKLCIPRDCFFKTFNGSEPVADGNHDNLSSKNPRTEATKNTEKQLRDINRKLGCNPIRGMILLHFDQPRYFIALHCGEFELFSGCSPRFGRSLVHLVVIFSLGVVGVAFKQPEIDNTYIYLWKSKDPPKNSCSPKTIF